MENEINTATSLNQLQEQYNVLKRKFDTQQIVNHDLLHQVAQAKMGKLQRKLRLGVVFLIVILAFSWTYMVFVRNLSPAFCITYLVVMLYVDIYTIVRFRKVLKKTTTTEDLLAAARTYKSSYNVSKVYRLITIPTSILFVLWFLLEWYHTPLSQIGQTGIDPTAIICVLIGYAACIISSLRNKPRDTAVCDEIISSLSKEDELPNQ